MGDTFGDAVDRAVTDLSAGGDQPPATPAAPNTSTTPPPSSTAAASPPAVPAAGSGTEPQPPTSTQPATGAKDQGDDDGETLNSKDWLSLEKRREILKGARDKQRRVMLQELGLKEETPLDALRPHLTLMMADPAEYYRQLGETLRARGVIPAEPAAPQVQPPPPPPPQPRRPPQPDLVFADGRQAYSAEAAANLVDFAMAMLRGEFAQVLEDRLSPLQQTHEAVRTSQIRQQAYTVASEAINEASTWIHFEELRPKIAALMAADKRVTLQSAYNRLLQEKMKTEPAKIREETRLATLKEIQQAPHQAQGIVPRSGAAITNPNSRPKTMDDVFGDAVSKALQQHASQLQ